MVKNNKGQTGMIGWLVVIFIVVIVGTALLPSVAQNVGTATADGNMSSQPAAVTVISLSTLMYVLLIVGSVVGLVMLGLRAIGMI